MCDPKRSPAEQGIFLHGGMNAEKNYVPFLLDGERVVKVVCELTVAGGLAIQVDETGVIRLKLESIPGPMLQIQSNRWERPEDLGPASFNGSGRLELGVRRHPWSYILVEPEYLDNVCDVLGIEKPEEPE